MAYQNNQTCYLHTKSVLLISSLIKIPVKRSRNDQTVMSGRYVAPYTHRAHDVVGTLNQRHSR